MRGMKKWTIGCFLGLLGIATLFGLCRLWAGVSWRQFFDHDYPGDVAALARDRSSDPREVRALANEVAKAYLTGFNEARDPGDAYLQASYCYSILADSSFARPGDRALAERYVAQAVKLAKWKMVLIESLAELAAVHVRHGRRQEAEAIIARVKALGLSPDQGKEFASWVLKSIKEAEAQMAHGPGPKGP